MIMVLLLFIGIIAISICIGFANEAIDGWITFGISVIIVAIVSWVLDDDIDYYDDF